MLLAAHAAGLHGSNMLETLTGLPSAGTAFNCFLLGVAKRAPTKGGQASLKLQCLITYFLSVLQVLQPIVCTGLADLALKGRKLCCHVGSLFLVFAPI